jgi:hypothetical protein
MATAFVAAAQRRFPPGWTVGDVVLFVGHVRARHDAAHEDLTAASAEQMLLSILRGEPIGSEFDEVTKGYAQITLLTELVSDLNEEELSTFLAQTREQADTWLAHQSPR